MKKRLIGSSFLLVMLINLVSATFHYGSRLSLTSMLDLIDPTTLVLVSLFIIFYIFINNRVMSKLFERTPAAGAIISFLVSLLAVYGINRSRFDILGSLYSVGIPEDMVFIIVSIILLIGLLGLSFKRDPISGRKKFRFYRALIMLGLIFIVLAFTNIIYEAGASFLIGLILLIFGWLLRKKSKSGESFSYYGGRGYDAAKDYADPRYRATIARERDEKKQQKRNAKDYLRKRRNKKWKNFGRRNKNSNNPYPSQTVFTHKQKY